MTPDQLRIEVARWNREGRSMTLEDEDGFLLIDTLPVESFDLVRIIPTLDRGGKVVGLGFWVVVKFVGWLDNPHYAHLVRVVSCEEHDGEISFVDAKGRHGRIHYFTDEVDSGTWELARQEREQNKDEYEDGDRKIVRSFGIEDEENAV